MSVKLTQIALIVIVVFVVYQGHAQVAYRQSCGYLAKLNQVHKVEQISQITPMNLQEKHQIAGALRASFENFADNMAECK